MKTHVMANISAGGARPQVPASQFLEQLFAEKPSEPRHNFAQPALAAQTSRLARNPAPPLTPTADAVVTQVPQHEVEVPSSEYLNLDPASILEEGPYIRQYIDDDALEALALDLAQEQGVEQAIGVREVRRESGHIRYALIYGRRRLHAARKAGLAHIRVRNYGRVSIRESLALQARENDQRLSTHDVDTAISYQTMVMMGEFTQAEISRIVGKEASYISYMRAVGEAILCLTETERAQLYDHPDARVATFQALAKLHPLENRIAALRRLLDPASAPDAPRVKRRPTNGGSVTRKRDAYRFYYLVTDAELITDADAALRAAEQFCAAQLAALRYRAAELRRSGGSEGAAPDVPPEMSTPTSPGA
jgi:ParB/RepB/Spo0J family partition protein